MGKNDDEDMLKDFKKKLLKALEDSEVLTVIKKSLGVAVPSVAGSHQEDDSKVFRLESEIRSLKLTISDLENKNSRLAADNVKLQASLQEQAKVQRKLADAQGTISKYEAEVKKQINLLLLAKDKVESLKAREAELLKERVQWEEQERQLQKQQATSLAQAQYYQTNYRNVEEVFQAYQALQDYTKELLTGVFRVPTPIGLAMYFGREENFANLWKSLARYFMEGRVLEDRAGLQHLLAVVVEFLNEQHGFAYYQLDTVALGTDFDSDEMQRQNPAIVRGQVAEVLLSGYSCLEEGEYTKQEKPLVRLED